MPRESLKQKKAQGSYKPRSQVPNKKHINLNDLLNFLTTCQHFIVLLKQVMPQEIDLADFQKLKGKIVYSHKEKFKKAFPELPGLDKVEKYLKLVELSSDDNSIHIMNDSDGKPFVGINVIGFVVARLLSRQPCLVAGKPFMLF